MFAMGIAIHTLKVHWFSNPGDIITLSHEANVLDSEAPGLEGAQSPDQLRGLGIGDAKSIDLTLSAGAKFALLAGLPPV